MHEAVQAMKPPPKEKTDGDGDGDDDDAPPPSPETPVPDEVSKALAEYEKLKPMLEAAGAAKRQKEEAALSFNDEELEQLEKLFVRHDADGNGTLDIAEFHTLMGELGEQTGRKLPKESVDALFKRADKDGSGTLDFKEFVAMQVTGRHSH